MICWIIFVSIGAILLFFFLFYRVQEKRLVALFYKGLTSLMFVLTAIVTWQTSNGFNNFFGLFVVFGLIFGLLGDIFLDLKYIIIKKEDFYTVLGFAAFGIGHIFFSCGLLIFFYNYNQTIFYILIPLFISIFFSFVSLLLQKFTPIRYKNMKPCVVIYGFLLFFVTTLFFAVAIQSEFRYVTIVIMAPSFVAFTLSDLILNNTYFAPNCNTPIYVISNHVLYYFAQFAIAISLYFLI